MDDVRNLLLILSVKLLGGDLIIIIWVLPIFGNVIRCIAIKSAHDAWWIGRSTISGSGTGVPLLTGEIVPGSACIVNRNGVIDPIPLTKIGIVPHGGGTGLMLQLNSRFQFYI